MTLGDTVRLAIRNLGQAKLRTTLTVMGVSIGIASLAGMVSLGVGLQDQFVGRFTQSGMFDSVTVFSARNMPGGFLGIGRGRGGRRGGSTTSTDTPRRNLDDEAIKEIAAIANVKDVYPNLRVPVEARLGDFSEFTTAAGVPMSSRGEGAFQTITHGAFFDTEVDEACMLSLDMAKRIDEAHPEALIGQSLTLAYATSTPSSGGVTPPDAAAPFQVARVSAPCRIVGIVERESGPGLGGSTVSALMIPLARARTLNATVISGPRTIVPDRAVPRSYTSLTVKVSRAQFTQDVQEQVKTMGFSAFSLNDALQQAKRAFLILDIVLSLIGSIALAVSSLGIVNTMVMSILERTREIGIMKAIGGSDADIRRIFLVEASAIGLLGGVAGIVLGWAVGRAINFGANIYIQNQGGTPGNLFSLPFWLIGGAIGFSVVVSLIAGSYPAARAARLDPIQALRHD